MIAAELQSLTQKQIQSKFSQFNKKEFAKVPAVISLSHLKTTHTATSTYQTNNLTLNWPFLTFDPILTFLAQKFQPVISIAFFILWLKFLSIVKIWISVYIANQWELRSFNQSDQLESFWSGLNQSELFWNNIKKNAVYGQLLLNEKMYSATLGHDRFKCDTYEIVIMKVRQSALESRTLDSDWPKMYYDKNQKTFFENCQFSVSYFFFFQNNFLRYRYRWKLESFFKSRYYTILYKDFYK